MAFRGVSVLEIKEVLRRWRARDAKKRIAAQVGTDVKTVRRYLKVVAKLGLGPEADLDVVVAAVVVAPDPSRESCAPADSNGRPTDS